MRWFYLIGTILSGGIIAVSSMLYASCSNFILASILFAIGIIAITNYHLITYNDATMSAKYNEWYMVLFVLLGNIIGCLLVLLFPNMSMAIVATKLSYTISEVFTRAFLGGLVYYLMIIILNNKPINAILCSMALMMCCEYSVADICFILNARVFNVYSLLFIITVLIGNAVGSILANVFFRWYTNDKKLQKKTSNH